MSEYGTSKNIYLGDKLRFYFGGYNLELFISPQSQFPELRNGDSVAE